MVPTFGGFENQLRAVFGICYPSSSENNPMNNINPHPPALLPIKMDVDDEMQMQNVRCPKMPKTDKTQKCRLCDKILSSPSSYYVHMKSHSQSKPYQCNFCDAAFCRKPYLSVHLRTHTGEKPYKCESCDKRFTQKSSLNTHKRVHTGERPYACDLCDKKFAVKSYVISHRWSHMASDKPLKCEDCELSFTSKSQYMMHIRVHSHAKNYECAICGRLFVKQSYLIRHNSKAHHNRQVILYNPQTNSFRNYPGPCTESPSTTHSESSNQIV